MFHTTDVLKVNDLLNRACGVCISENSSGFLLSARCELMRTVEVCRREGPVVLAAVDGAGRDWLFLDAIEGRAS